MSFGRKFRRSKTDWPKVRDLAELHAWTLLRILGLGRALDAGNDAEAFEHYRAIRQSAIVEHRFWNDPRWTTAQIRGEEGLPPLP